MTRDLDFLRSDAHRFGRIGHVIEHHGRKIVRPLGQVGFVTRFRVAWGRRRRERLGHRVVSWRGTNIHKRRETDRDPFGVIIRPGIIRDGRQRVHGGGGRGVVTDRCGRCAGKALSELRVLACPHPLGPALTDLILWPDPHFGHPLLQRRPISHHIDMLLLSKEQSSLLKRILRRGVGLRVRGRRCGGCNRVHHVGLPTL